MDAGSAICCNHPGRRYRRAALAAGVLLQGVALPIAPLGCTASPPSGLHGVPPAVSQPAGTVAATAPARASDGQREFPLDSLRSATITIHDRPIHVWLALTPAQRAEGLMHVPASELPDDQGMLFVFPDEDLRAFWMKDTITALDIAFARYDGTVVQTWLMPPLTLRTFPSLEPALFALEMRAGAFQKLGLRAGDRIAIPSEVFHSP
jgi:uncharacterized membrane protein (UPF0127 family)